MVNQQESLNQPTQGRRKQLVTKPWRFLIITVLVIGIFFRFANLDQKVYWGDEVTNSIHSSGHSKLEVLDLIFSDI